jgi:hypothetical protein
VVVITAGHSTVSLWSDAMMIVSSTSIYYKYSYDYYDWNYYDNQKGMISSWQVVDTLRYIDDVDDNADYDDNADD